MARTSKKIILPHLNDCGGDVSGKWYVQYSVVHPQTGKKIRPRIYEGFDKFSTAKQRYAYADLIIEEYTEKLNSGWLPFELPIVEYEDALAYHNSKTFAPKTVKAASLISPLFAEYLDWKKPRVAASSLEDYRSKLRQFSLYLKEKNLLNKDLTYYNNVLIIEFPAITEIPKNTLEKVKGWVKQGSELYNEYPKIGDFLIGLVSGAATSLGGVAIGSQIGELWGYLPNAKQTPQTKPNITLNKQTSYNTNPE